MQSHADIATSLLVRAPRVAVEVQYPDTVRSIKAELGAVPFVVQTS